MPDIALQTAGALAITVSLAHGVLGEYKVFARARIEQPRTRNLLRMVWQASTIDWIGIGVLLIAAPAFGSATARHWIVAVAVLVYGYAAIGNAIANRGRHIGWVLMSVVVVLIIVGR
jgi:uncharacterized membrane protein HdeD (DUF308 family)